MITIDIGSPLGAPGTLAITEDWSDPVYIAARADYEYIYFVQACRTAGKQLKITEVSDLSSLVGEGESTLDAVTAWFDAFLLDKATEVVENGMELAPLISALVTCGSSEVLPVMLGFIFNLLVTSSQRDARQEEQDTQVIAGAGDIAINVLNNEDEQEEYWSSHT